MPEKLTRVELSNLEKILYPQLKITKGRVIEYYIRMAPRMLELLAKRPLVLTRYPDGIDKEGFYEKDAPKGAPSWVKTFRHYSETAERNIDYILCNDLDTLIWMANLAALEIHMPLSTIDSLEKPDLILFDVDPEPPATIEHAVTVAVSLKEKLEALSIKSYVKTSGKKGIHVVVPLVRQHTFKQTREFAHTIGKNLAAESGITVSEFPRSREPGTVFVDYLQNSHGRTMICPYSLRATPQATVSTPLEWEDVKKGLKPEEFNISNVVKIKKNPWARLLKDRQKLDVK